ncbi:MAG: response regulator transcription factor [Bacteroidota bacterium]
MKLTTLIVDDEPLARSGLSDYVGRIDFLTEIGQAKDGMEALSLLSEQSVNLLLLDVQMPGLSGVDLLRSLERPPAVVFTTAHPSFAVEGFELNAVDYLLKPISFPRFLRAMLKVRSRYTNNSPTVESVTLPEMELTEKKVAAPVTDLFIREEGRVERILLADILYAESMQNYCRIHTTTGSYLPLIPLKELREALPEADFMQIHRSYIVNLRAVNAIVGHQVRIGNDLLPVSRPNRAQLEQRLVGNRLL